MTDRRGQLRLILVTAVAAAVSVAAACTAAPTPAPTPMPSPSPTPAATTTIEVRPPTGVDYVALETELKRRLAAGPETVKEVRSILISVDGTTELAFYQGSKATDHRHVWSVTKSVLSILVGIAVDEGKLRLDQPLAELLPEHASVMTDDQKATTLRQLLTMTGGMAGDGGGLNPEAEDPIGELLTYSAVGQRTSSPTPTPAPTWWRRCCTWRSTGRSWTMRARSCSTRSASTPSRPGRASTRI